MSNNSIPVLLYYHINYDNNDRSVTPEAFESQLRFLKEEGYRSVTKEELGDFLTTGKMPYDKAIVVTLDGGYLDSWVYAYPLLKKYGFKAIAFVISWNVEEDEYLGFNLDDYYSGKIKKEMLPDCKTTYVVENGIKKQLERRLCWREVREMEKSKIIDIQPNSKFHRMVYAGEKIIGFNSIENKIDSLNMVRGDERLGTPNFERKPEFSSKEFAAFQDLRDRLAQYVIDNGYINFFKKDSWQGELKNIVEEYKKENNTDKIGEWETDEEYEKRIRTDLEVAKGEIGWETKKICTAFAWPFGLYSELALKTAKDIGFKYLFTTKKGANSYGDSPYEIKRLTINNDNMDWFKEMVLKYSNK